MFQPDIQTCLKRNRLDKEYTGRKFGDGQQGRFIQNRQKVDKTCGLFVMYGFLLVWFCVALNMDRMFY